jgi:hypothetical protein
METVDADRIVRRIFEGGINKGDFAAVAKHVAASYVDQSPIPASGPGPDELRRSNEGSQGSFWRSSDRDPRGGGIRQPDLVSLDPRPAITAVRSPDSTNREADTGGSINLEMMDGEKVVEHFSLFDRLSLMQQLNPPPAEWAGRGVSTLLHPSEATGKGAGRAGGVGKAVQSLRGGWCTVRLLLAEREGFEPSGGLYHPPLA